MMVRLIRFRNFAENECYFIFILRTIHQGCTCEAEEFRDAIADFKKQKTAVFGISCDSIASHKKFAEKLRLPFALLSDEKKQW